MREQTKGSSSVWWAKLLLRCLRTPPLLRRAKEENTKSDHDSSMIANVGVQEKEKRPIVFELSIAEKREADKFIEQQRANYVKDMRAKFKANPPRPGSPQYRQMKFMEETNTVYEGCSGGAVTYSFTPTSLGVAATVRYSPTQQELDLTDYDEW